MVLALRGCRLAIPVPEHLLVGLGLLRLKQFLREFCWPTICTIVGVSLLLGLGTWQLQRLSRKEKLIAEVTGRIHQPVQAIAHLLNQPLSSIREAEYQRVQMDGIYLHDQEMRLMAKTFQGKAGYHLITPLVLNSGSTVLVDRGWVPSNGQHDITHPQGPQTVMGYLRLKSSRTVFTPPNNFAQNEIFSVEPEEIARLKKLTTLLPFFVIEEIKPQQDGFPRAVGLNLTLQNHHLEYAMTWYLLALILAIMYILYIRKKI